MPTTPEEVLFLALQRHHDRDYHGIVALCDPESVATFFREYCLAEPTPTIEQVIAERPGITASDAARVRDRLEEMSRDDLLRRARAIPGIQDYDELLAMDPADFFARWLERNDPRFNFLQRLRERGRPIPESVLLQQFRYMVVDRLESDGEALVRFREVNERDSLLGPIEYEHLRRGLDGEWRLLARSLLLLPRAGTVMEIPHDLMDLYNDEGRSSRR